MTTVVNLKKETYDVYIGREGHGKDGYFGNSHPIGKPCYRMTCSDPTHPSGRIIHDRDSAIAAYKEDFEARIQRDAYFLLRVLELRDKKLGCFCKPDNCHGDVIKEWLDKHPNLK